MRPCGMLAALVALVATVTQAASTFKPTKPPAVPLAVRSPYLSAWLQGEAGGILPGTWPQFWTYVHLVQTPERKRRLAA